MLLLVLSVSCASWAGRKGADVERIAPAEAKMKLERGEALMVCSYDDAQCRNMLIQGALLKSEFEERVGSLDRGAEVIFYCD